MSKIWFTRLLDARVRIYGFSDLDNAIKRCCTNVLCQRHFKEIYLDSFQEEYLHNNPFVDTEELENYSEKIVSSILYLTLEGVGTMN